MIEYNLSKRWEDGIPHHPKSIELYKRIENLDFELGGDVFCFKSGGDGDNGEHLMYLMDIYFEEKDTKLPIIYDNGQPCVHTGCLSHKTHPCEWCGRIEGKGIIYEEEE